jgi:hypothetical protein
MQSVVLAALIRVFGIIFTSMLESPDGARIHAAFAGGYEGNVCHHFDLSRSDSSAW